MDGWMETHIFGIFENNKRKGRCSALNKLTNGYIFDVTLLMLKVLHIKCMLEKKL